MNKKGLISGILAVLVVLFLGFFVLLIPINAHSVSFWMMLVVAAILYAVFYSLACGTKKKEFTTKNRMGNVTVIRMNVPGSGWKVFLAPAVLAVITIVLGLSGAKVFHAHRYASVINLQDAEFSTDIAESVGTDSIALMDSASAKMLGDREIGSLSSVVSQYNVSGDYTQIDFKGKPMKVAALEYAGFFKWINNKANGVPGYVTVNPVTMSASYEASTQGMIYVPSAYLLEDAGRRIRMKYPTAMFDNLHFEIDEEGNPYYVASVYKMTISMFGGETVSGCIILDPVTGEMTKYALSEVPTWVDVVMDGNLICAHYNWYGTLQNGFLNSIFAKKGCKQVTVYTPTGDEEDDLPTSDYGYVAKDGDIWIYTGVTSVNGDSSNIGFLLANERTGEAHYFNIAGADEKSAMAAAEGEVQEKRYQASFPSLINVDGNPTYIMVMKDASGLVKLYAVVNVEQYNLVTTAPTQAECLAKYRKLLGIEAVEPGKEELEADNECELVVADIRDIVIDGNTYIYLIGENGELFKGKASKLESLLLVKPGDTVKLKAAGNEIVSVE